MSLYAVYMMSNKKRGTIYTGSTDNLPLRVQQHKLGFSIFTKKYNLDKCVYFELCDNTEAAMQMEARYKGYNRQWKIDLIEKFNPEWKDLSEDFNNLLPF